MTRCYKFIKRYSEHLILAPIAVILVMLGVSFLNEREAAQQMAVQQQLAERPATDWFTVNFIAIPDFRTGEDPTISYDRTILQPFFGRWFAEINRVGTSRADLACEGSGTRSYTPGDPLPDPVTLSWLMQKDCHLMPGQYQVIIKWQIDRPGIQMQAVDEATSHVFRVTD